MERARLKISSPASPTVLKCSVAAGGAEATSNTTLVHRREAFSDNRCGAANSSYFTDIESVCLVSHTSSTLSGEKSMNMDIYGEKDQHSVQSRETLSSTPCDSLIFSKVSDSSLKDCDHLVPENVVPAENLTSIPRLSLELTREPDYGRTAGVSEEKLPFNKVEKEACNSSIRGSSGGSVGPQKEHEARDSGGSHSPGPPQAG